MRIALVVLELFTGVTAIAGGLLFILEPDGSLLGADVTLLDGTPFADWLVPGILLLAVVGLAFVAAGIWQWRRAPGAEFVSLAGGIGLIVFEVVEFALIGFHPLQPVYALVGATIVLLSVRLAARRVSSEARDAPRAL